MTRFAFVLASMIVVVSGCGQSTTTEKSKTKDYPLRGKVTAVDAPAKSVTIDHEDIPGLMKGMEMKFHVESEAALAGVKAGDHVEGRVTPEASGYMVRGLKAIGAGDKK